MGTVGLRVSGGFSSLNGSVIAWQVADGAVMLEGMWMKCNTNPIEESPGLPKIIDLKHRAEANKQSEAQG